MNYDLIVDLHKNLRSWQVKRQLGVKPYSFRKLNIEKWLLVNAKINFLPNKHIVDRNLETVADLEVENDGKGLDYFIPEHDEVEPSDFISFTSTDKNYIAFAIGAAHATKRLPNEKIIAICNGIALPIVLLGGKEDKINSDLIHSKSSSYIVNLVGKLNLNQSASVVRQAYKVITHDTGLMHIAAAFQKKIISIWGSTVPEFGMTPYTK
ncbi:MAG: glycosyltransferase family 9 protein, partial [Saprospiraceae bacterium]|nr:glycosyltransferase family 9 protein [Saprospiraceae bacterium]